MTEKCSCGKNDAILENGMYTLCYECRNKLLSVSSYLNSANIPYNAQKFSLDNFDSEKVKKIFQLTNKLRTNIILSGESYCGKTTLLCSLYKFVVERAKNKPSGLFVNVPSLIYNTVYEIKDLVQPDILILDDYINATNEKAYWLLYNSLNLRAEKEKVTWTSTNLTDIKDSRLKSRLLRMGGNWINVTKDIQNNEKV